MLKKWQESQPVFFSQLSQLPGAAMPILAIEGSMTIQQDGEIIGGLGIAGGTADEDQIIADEVLQALGYEMEFAAWGVAGTRSGRRAEHGRHVQLPHRPPRQPGPARRTRDRRPGGGGRGRARGRRPPAQAALHRRHRRRLPREDFRSAVLDTVPGFRRTDDVGPDGLVRWAADSLPKANGPCSPATAPGSPR
ncbi:hypothetical protein SHKM778_56030 [Streptomyces sp. KM77-8]|uniref:Heme-binding protein n=1 Tax=Streptomyces haneummycinicus TaxID=3074435 RepID=A0AAT9HP71_9ACTN